MKTFDVKNIDLDNKNLIEASAGTGKTYSIGILLIRLLLEKDIRIEQILMVTFTNAAVAELEIRTRAFLRESLKITTDINNDKSDETIQFIVKRAIEKKGRDEVKKLLEHAILFLDETSIFTIHSFCQLTLSEFAFETKQLFNTELIEDQTSIIETSVNAFWRGNITILDESVLEVLSANKFSRKLLVDFSKSIFNGKKLVINNTIDSGNIVADIANFQKRIENVDQIIKDKIKDNWQNIIDTIKHTNTKVYKAVRNNNNKKEFFNELISTYSNNSKAKVLATLTYFFDDIERYIAITNEFELFKKDIFIFYLAKTGEFVKKEVEKKKNRNQVLSFHDLIGKLHTELVENNNKDLKFKLCNKYKAVFIDEFQDTDHLQYEIFKKAFIDDCNSIVFFIGDPKQSIYAWRGADLRTYIKAQEDIGDNKFTMRNNYRSIPKLIDAMNEFFPSGRSCDISLNNKSNPFCSDSITYEEVAAGNKNLGKLYNKNNEASTFDIIYQDNANKSEMLEAAGTEIVDLLANHFIEKNGGKRRVRPSDIRILVRSHGDSGEMKNILSRYSIPAIIIDDTKIMETDDARDLYYILVAIENPDKRNLSRALLTSFIGFNSNKIVIQDIDFHKKHFVELLDIWKQSGVFSAIIHLTTKYNTRKKLLDTNNPNGNRIYTNLMQLVEILNEKELFSSYSPVMLLEWFKKMREGMNILNKYEQRIESDDEAVEILTIHKSKGLSFNIVIMPWLNLQIKSEGKLDAITLLKEDGFYTSYYKTKEEIEIYKRQSEEENRRLIYVAITRAAYKCIIHFNNKPGSLNYFIPNLDKNSTNISHREALPAISYTYKSTDDIVKEKTPLNFKAKLNDSWRLTSYSALDAHESTYVYKKDEKKEGKDEYDLFIFNQLSKGAQTGNILHNILENIDFTGDKYWENTIKKQLSSYGRETSPTIIDNFKILLHHIISSELNDEAIRLKEIENIKRFNELEFYFSFSNWDPKKIKELIPQINIFDKNIEGIMHGFIDLLFEYNGKYYILDWKSNHLGFDIQNYSIDDVEKAMTDNNYHLQYYVYTIAVKRFLEKRIPDFEYDKHFGGVFYLFLRGIRKDSQSGIFFSKPEKETIDKLNKLLN